MLKLYQISNLSENTVDQITWGGGDLPRNAGEILMNIVENTQLSSQDQN